jgi:hypothetical protein
VAPIDTILKIMYNIKMYKVISKDDEQEFDNLDLAMSYAKSLNVFVTIKSNEFEVVGKFGVDEVTDPSYNGWISRKKGV